MVSQSRAFGALVRRERQAREIGLREMARMVCLSPTYISRVERGETPPPAEDKIKAIAEVINGDVDELLGIAGRVATDLVDIILQHPREMAALIRNSDGFTAQELEKLAKEVKKRRRRENSIL